MAGLAGKVKSFEVESFEIFWRDIMAANSVPGSVGWMDLTVENADEVAQFYEQVVGWERQGIDMGGYEDWCMGPPGASAPAGSAITAIVPNCPMFRNGQTTFPPRRVHFSRLDSRSDTET